MYDHQTNSLWSQVSGECIKGPHLGKKLELFPSSFSTFSEAHKIPGIVFLAKPARGPGQSPYQAYFEDRGRLGIFGTTYRDTLINGKDLIYGLRSDDRQMAIPAKIFETSPAQIIAFAGECFIVTRTGENSVAGYRVKNGDCDKIRFSSGEDMITFESDADTEISRVPLQDLPESDRVINYPIISSFWFAWKAFFPATEVHK